MGRVYLAQVEWLLGQGYVPSSSWMPQRRLGVPPTQVGHATRPTRCSLMAIIWYSMLYTVYMYGMTRCSLMAATTS